MHSCSLLAHTKLCTCALTSQQYLFHYISLISRFTIIEIVLQLQRTKASSLKEWLKREGVLYSSREKKDDLIRKVVHCLQENGQKEFKI